MNARRTAGENDSTRMECFYIFQGHIEGMNLTIDLTHPDSPCNQLSVLRTKVQYEDSLLMDVLHGVALSKTKRFTRERNSRTQQYPTIATHFVPIWLATF